MERVKGEKQTLADALARPIRLQHRTSEARGIRSGQFTMTIPYPIGLIMERRTSTWRFELADQGVLIVPIDFPDENPDGLPGWARGAE